jgi:hypothetical protein
MDPLTAHMLLMDSLDSKKKTQYSEEELPKEIAQKLKLIEKAFK